MATENFSIIQKTKILSDSDKILIGKSEGDFSTRLEDLKDFLDPGKNLLIFDRDPIVINNSATTEEAAREYSFYDYVVFDMSLSENEDLMEIIPRTKEINPSIRIFGSISGDEEMQDLEIKILNWKNAGATDICVMTMDYSEDVDRTKQNNILEFIHNHEMNAMIQAEDPDNVFSDDYDEDYNPNFVPTSAIEGDLFLSYNFIVGEYNEDNDYHYSIPDFIAREDKIINYVKELGIIPCAYDFLGDHYYNNFFVYLNAVAITMGKKAYGVGINTDSTVLNDYSYISEQINFKKVSSKTYTKNIEYFKKDSIIYRYYNGFTMGFVLEEIFNSIRNIIKEGYVTCISLFPPQ